MGPCSCWARVPFVRVLRYRCWGLPATTSSRVASKLGASVSHGGPSDHMRLNIRAASWDHIFFRSSWIQTASSSRRNSHRAVGAELRLSEAGVFNI